MKDKITSGTITNLETGKTSNIEPFYLYYNPAEISAIVKVLCVESLYDSTKQVFGDCLALDCQGNVYKLSLNFLPESPDDEQKIISEFTKGKIMVVSGRYCLQPKAEDTIMLFDIQYKPLPSEYSLEEVEEVFRFNNSERIRKDVKDGDVYAQVDLGNIYAEGDGVEQDFAEAAKWYRKAAEQEYHFAQYLIGSMYKEGKGVPRDYEEAVKWFRKAADQGSVDARLELDKMKDK